MPDASEALAPGTPALGGAPVRAYFHGNCQLPLLSKLIAEVRPHWRITAREVHGRDAINEKTETEADAASADVIVAQTISDNYRGVDFLSFNAIRAMARPDALIIRVPSLYFAGQLPGWGYLGANEKRLRGLRMPYNAYPVAAMVLAGMTPEAILTALCSRDFFAGEFVLAGFDASVTELRRREAGSADIPVSDLYAERGRQRPVAHTVNHPLRHLAAALANRVLRQIGDGPEVADEGADYLALPHIPLLPSVEKALGLPRDPQRAFNLAGQERPLRYYLPRLAAYYAALPADDLRGHLLASREAMTFLAGYAAAHPEAAWARITG